MSFDGAFALPFSIGCAVMFAVIGYKFVRWIYILPDSDKRLICRNILSRRSWQAVGECITEALLHRRIFRVNPLLGYMHASLAVGWFLLIVVGAIEVIYYLSWKFTPLRGHVFFRYYAREIPHTELWQVVFANVMDALLTVVLSGVVLAWYKRAYSRMMGMRRTTRHIVGDRVALAALWSVFPARLLAESVTAALWHNGGFLTEAVGKVLASVVPQGALLRLEGLMWLFYALALGIFFCAMPFSRYMHIFTEIPLIFLRRWGVQSDDRPKSFDHFQIEACSRCGLCIDVCQLGRDAQINNVQGVYFLRDRRYGVLAAEPTDNCLMCGRCSQRCPVGLDINALRQNSRYSRHNSPAFRRYDYLRGVDSSTGSGNIGYFAGCMTHLSPHILMAMNRIFEVAGEKVWLADPNGGVCCGRPLKLAGEVDASREMMRHNTALFVKHQIKTLVTSCPICLKVFREEYNLQNIEVLHHSEYIHRLTEQGKLLIKLTDKTFAYHDPCELGRGCGVYAPPRSVIKSLGELVEPTETEANSLCCGSSIANTAISDQAQLKIATSLGRALEATGADEIITACPLCKKAVRRGTKLPVRDLAEAVANRLYK